MNIIPIHMTESWLSRVAHSPHTQKNYIRILRSFEAYCDGATIDDLRDRAYKFIEDKKKKDSSGNVTNCGTVNVIAYILSSFFGELVSRGMLNRNPLSDFKGYPAREYSNKKSLSTAEMDNLLRILRNKANETGRLYDARTFMMAYFLYKYALRASSLVRLEYPEGDVLNIWTKRNRNIQQPLTPDAKLVLNWYKQFDPKGKFIIPNLDNGREGDPVTVRTVQKIIRDLTNGELSSHSFRKSHAVNAIKQGRSVVEVANGLAASSKTAMYYAREDNMTHNSILFI